MTIYNIPNVSYEPSCEVCNWKIVSLMDSFGSITKHIVGEERYGGRVSTQIVGYHYDNDSLVEVTTASGRVYKLLGKSAENITSDASYVLTAFMQTNGLEMCDE